MPKLIDKESDRLSVRVTFNMTQYDHESLVNIAGKQHVPFGQILRALVRDYLKRTNKG